MSVPARTPLGASTTVRKWYLDVNTGTDTAPVWTGVFGITNFQPTYNPTLQDDSDFDSQGYKSSTATALEWGATLTVSRKAQADAPTAYDPGQEKLRAVASTLGTSNRVQVRFYEMEPNGPREEAYSGYCAVTWAPQGGAMDALDTVQVTLTGQGQRSDITHPDGTSDTPVITSLSPSTGVAAGDEIVLSGSYLSGATAVTVAGTPLASSAWDVVSDGEIVFVAPAHATGAATVTVTTPGGTSASVNLTYA